MSYFKAKMNQIRFRLGLCPRPRWRSLQRSSRPPMYIKKALLFKGEGGEGERMGREKGGGGRGRKRERGGEGRELPRASRML